MSAETADEHADATRAVLGTRRVEPRRPGDPDAIEGYRITHRLPGGMTQIAKLVGEAADGSLVVIKIPEPDSDAGMAALLPKEFAQAQRVRSKRVARVLREGTFQGRPFFVQELAPGRPLLEMLEEAPDGRLDLEDAKRLAVGVLEALADVHAAHVVHADLKPSNVIVGARGVRLVDFGAARTLRAEQQTAPLGTPRYVSREHLRHAPLTEHSDLFVWGLLVTRAATGRHAYDSAGELGDDEYHLRLLDTGAQPDLAELPAPLRRAVSAALVGVAGRPATTEQLLRMLERADVTRTITALVPLEPTWQDRLSTRYWRERYDEPIIAARDFLGQPNPVPVYAAGIPAMTAAALLISFLLAAVLAAFGG